VISELNVNGLSAYKHHHEIIITSALIFNVHIKWSWNNCNYEIRTHEWAKSYLRMGNLKF